MPDEVQEVTETAVKVESPVVEGKLERYKDLLPQPPKGAKVDRSEDGRRASWRDAARWYERIITGTGTVVDVVTNPRRIGDMSIKIRELGDDKIRWAKRVDHKLIRGEPSPSEEVKNPNYSREEITYKIGEGGKFEPEERHVFTSYGDRCITIEDRIEGEDTLVLEDFTYNKEKSAWERTHISRTTRRGAEV